MISRKWIVGQRDTKDKINRFSGKGNDLAIANNISRSIIDKACHPLHKEIRNKTPFKQ
jgi:hypothetical protein